jgi:cytochrome b561
MRPTRSTSRYTLIAIILHWVMALGIGALVVIGLVMTHLKFDPMRSFRLYQLHKSVGITILLAALVRLAWRLTHCPPELPTGTPAIERKAASGGHLMLYIFLFALPFTGWALVSASVFDIPTVLYGIVPWPHLPILSTLADKQPVEDLLTAVHDYAAWAFIALVAVHAAAALRHHFIIGDDVLLRMLLGHRRKPSAQPARKEGPAS